MRRYDCLKAIAPKLGDELVVTNLANTATEWRAVRPAEGNLYSVGMGMVTPYALGLALALPSRRILAFDGDGGLLFDPSVLGTIRYNGRPIFSSWSSTMAATCRPGHCARRRRSPPAPSTLRRSAAQWARE